MKRLSFVALLIALAAACYDPVHADDVASLGDEAPGVPEGPLHRPGQHCTTCHGDVGPGSPQFSIAGTIFAVKNQPAPEVGAQVILTDKLGTPFPGLLLTNAAGNFYIPKEQWDPVFPVSVQIKPADPTIPAAEIPVMFSKIGRDGGCGACHRGVRGAIPDRLYPPQVYVRPK